MEAPTFELRRPIVVDTETYYDGEGCSVVADKKIDWVGGNWHYTHHPAFYCYMITMFDPATGVSYVTDDRDTMANVIKGLEDRTIIAHNAGFDIAVLQSIVPDFKPFNTFDTADMASYLQAPRPLADASETLLGLTMDKTVRTNMKGQHYNDLSHAGKQAVKEYALKDAVNTGQLFIKYNSQWPAIEQWMSNYTREQNEAGIHIDVDYLAEQLDKVGTTRNAARALIPWAEEGTPMSSKKLAEYCREVGILPPESLAEDSEECQAWEAQYGDTYPVVGAIRDYRKSNTYFKKLTLIENLLRPDGTIPLATKYAAAPHTLRFSATQFNYQSLPRKADYCDLRGCLIPAPGHSFIGSDLAGIEARCLPWLAGNMDYLADVAKLDVAARSAGKSGGGDIYEPAARRMFGYSDARPLKATDRSLREATKACVLQLGYQSGARKFLWYLNNNVKPEVLDRVRQPGETDKMLATRLVKLYRDLNPAVTGLWYGLDRELRTAAAKGEIFSVQQPNGRVVNYYDLAVHVGTDEFGRPREEITGCKCRGLPRAKLYGGKIAENICQEMARHVLVQTIYRLAQAGYRTRVSIHDENLLEVPKGTEAAASKAIEEIMSQTPVWAPGLPLAASTAVMQRYAKD